jgi:hypothetical protein
MTDGAANYRKGHAFEQQVAEYMKNHLGFVEVQTNVKLKGKIADSYEIDVLAYKRSRFWTAVWLLAIVAVVLAEVAIIAPRLVPRLTRTMTTAGARVQRTAGLASPVVGVAVLGFAVIVIGIIGDRHSRKRVLVECKNLQIRVNRLHIFHLDGKVQDIRKHTGTRSRQAITHVWFVSSSGYLDDAVSFAHQRGIELFQPARDTASMMLQRVY